MAVIDVAAIKQLVAQINYWKQQIDAMKKELNQLQQTHAALTGPRGMQALLPLDDRSATTCRRTGRAWRRCSRGRARSTGHSRSR